MENVTRIFKALSDPTRVRIIWLLQTGGELCVCDLITTLGLPQSTVSRHLASLRQAGLVLDRRQGIWMYYRLPAETDNLFEGVLAVIETAAADTPQAAIDRRRLSEALAARNGRTCSSCD